MPDRPEHAPIVDGPDGVRESLARQLRAAVVDVEVARAHGRRDAALLARARAVTADAEALHQLTVRRRAQSFARARKAADDARAAQQKRDAALRQAAAEPEPAKRGRLLAAALEASKKFKALTSESHRHQHAERTDVAADDKHGDRDRDLDRDRGRSGAGAGAKNGPGDRPAAKGRRARQAGGAPPKGRFTELPNPLAFAR